MNGDDSVIVRWLAAGDAGDFHVFDALLHPDVVVHAPGGLSTTNREQEKTVWREALAAISGLHHAVQEVIVEGGVEMARVVVSGRIVKDFGGVAGTGSAFAMDQAVIVHLRDGKVAEAWEIADVGAIRDRASGPD